MKSRGVSYLQLILPRTRRASQQKRKRMRDALEYKRFRISGTRKNIWIAFKRNQGY